MPTRPTITVINVAGLPQPLVRLLQRLVQGLHHVLPHRRPESRHFDLLIKPGRVLTPLDRRHLYEERG